MSSKTSESYLNFDAMCCFFVLRACSDEFLFLFGQDFKKFTNSKQQGGDQLTVWLLVLM